MDRTTDRTPPVSLRICRRALIRCALNLTIALGAMPTALADSTTNMNVESGDITFHHVYAKGARKEGEKPTFPKSLEDFADEFRKSTFASFRRVGGGKSNFPKSATTTSKLPDGLGTLTFEKKADGVWFKLEREKKKPITAKIPTKKKFYLEFDKLKNDKGEQYILLVSRD